MPKKPQALGNTGRCTKYRKKIRRDGAARISGWLSPEAVQAQQAIMDAGKADSKIGAVNAALIAMAKRVRS